VVSRDNYESFISGVLDALAGEAGNRELRGAISSFFNAHLVDVPAGRDNPIMRNMRALARVIKKLSGIEMMLTIERAT
jgi:hypothetical protein